MCLRSENDIEMKGESQNITEKLKLARAFIVEKDSSFLISMGNEG